MRSGSKSLPVALGASLLLHGALAAWALTVFEPARPAPIAVVPVTIVSLSAAPTGGTTRGKGDKRTSVPEAAGRPQGTEAPSPKPVPAPRPSAAGAVVKPPETVHETKPEVHIPVPAKGKAQAKRPEPSAKPAQAPQPKNPPVAREPEVASLPHPYVTAKKPEPAPEIERLTPRPATPATVLAAARAEEMARRAQRRQDTPLDKGAQKQNRRPAQAASLPSPASGVAESRTASPAAGNPRPEYPSLARRRRYEGRTVLRVHVTETGGVAQVTLAQTSGHGVLDRAAVDAVRRWRFIPARKVGAPVPSTVLVPVRFQLAD